MGEVWFLGLGAKLEARRAGAMSGDVVLGEGAASPSWGSPPARRSGGAL